MIAAPSAAAVLADMLWCLGLGCGVCMLRDIVGLVFGNGAVRCFLWDVLSFVVAAILICGFAASAGAGGLARWYMAGAMAGGALAWSFTVAKPVHRMLCRCARWVAVPFYWAFHRGVLPGICRLKRCLQPLGIKKKSKNLRKSGKSAKKQLQKPSKVLYN